MLVAKSADFVRKWSQTTSVKRYRALVVPSNTSSAERLKSLTGSVMTHWRSPVGPPKGLFQDLPPPDVPKTGKLSWKECKSIVLSVREYNGDSYTPPSTLKRAEKDEDELRRGGGSYQPLLEVELELITGRTHQLRGQLGAIGCPIYGDMLYVDSYNDEDRRYVPSPELCLQAKYLAFEFTAATAVTTVDNGRKKDDLEVSPRSFVFELQTAWWD